MLRIVYFSGPTKNTFRFISKLQLDPSLTARIPNDDTSILVDQPYVLILPTYANNRGENAIHPRIQRFLMQGYHSQLLRAVVSSGNKNFGHTYGLSGDLISQHFRIPLWLKFELFGMPSDVDHVRHRIVTCH